MTGTSGGRGVRAAEEAAREAGGPDAGTSFPGRLVRTRLYEQVAGQITTWVTDNHLSPGDRLPPERELAARLGVSRATLSQALVALEVIGAVSVRHGDGTVVTRVGAGLAPGGDEVGDAGTRRTVEAIRAHADRLPEIIDTRDALETKLAALAAERRTDGDLARIDAALRAMADDIVAGGRGVEGDEMFHAAVTAAAHSLLLARLMEEISDLIKETRLESLGQPGRPRDSLVGHQKVADAIHAQDPVAAAAAMHDHVAMVSDVALLRPDDSGPTGSATPA
jgi:GntR family transcriptional repressor for pyruvate dehydrogenase complex